jgi:hypothetical protein
MKNLLCLLKMSTLALLWPAGALAQDPRPAPITVLKESGPVMYGRAAKAKAVVEAIDLSTRHIVIKGPRGRSLTMRVEERVRNLPQVAVGDEVNVRYHEAVGVMLRKAEEADRVPAEAATEPSDVIQMPKTGPDARTTVVAAVEAVSPRDKSIALKMADGRYVELYVRDEALLETFKARDMVVATHTEPVVVWLEGPKDREARKEAEAKKKKRKP